MARIAIGGMQHETNTFAPTRADYPAFAAGGGWPGAQFGDALFSAVDGANIPAAGAIQALRAENHTLVGTAWAAASPAAHVTDRAFDMIVGELITRLEAAGRVDGVYLDLHGAMVTESFDDGEGEILRRVRAVVGPRVPIVASLDLHANVTQAMLQIADGMVAYRTYPHTDMAEAGARAVRLLHGMLKTGQRPACMHRRFDYLTALPSQCSLVSPAQQIYSLLDTLEHTHNVALSFTPGFPMADFAECGMMLFGYGEARDLAPAIASLNECIVAAEKEFALELLAPDVAIQRARERGQIGAPVVIADTQDNPGAGGNGDTTGMLAALIRQNPPDAVLGLLIDATSAARAHDARCGSRLAFCLGGQSKVPGDAPLSGEFIVEQLADGNFTCTGPMFKGFRMTLGPMAVLRSCAAPGVRVVLASRKCQAADQAMFRHVGIEPREQRLLVLKSSVHFRADFQPIAREILIARAPGPALADPADFPWTRLRPGLRLRPLGPAFNAAVD